MKGTRKSNRVTPINFETAVPTRIKIVAMNSKKAAAATTTTATPPPTTTTTTTPTLADQPSTLETSQRGLNFRLKLLATCPQHKLEEAEVSNERGLPPERLNQEIIAGKQKY
jgi:hypothetical protein